MDIEANGMPEPQICQLAYVLCGENMRPVKAVNRYFLVDKMNSFARRVHGLSVNMLKILSEGARFSDWAAEIHRDFYWADEIVGHNVSSDIDYLQREFMRCGIALPQRRRFCTMTRFAGCAGSLANGAPKPPRLSELWEYFGITESDIVTAAGELFAGGLDAHDARYDAAATWLIARRALGGDVSIGNAPG